MMQGVANCAKLGGNTMGKRIELADDSQIAAARAVGESGIRDPRAVAARYLPARDRVEIDLASGWSVRVPRPFSSRLAMASVHDCERIEIVDSGLGLGLHWPSIDEDWYVPTVIEALIFPHAAQTGARATDQRLR